MGPTMRFNDGWLVHASCEVRVNVLFFHETDAEDLRWVLATFADYIRLGFLHVGRTNPATPYFHASVCKNAAHRFALESLLDDANAYNETVKLQEVVVLSLDADNVASLQFMESLIRKAEAMGPLDVIRGSGDDGGVTGRIASFAELWIALGGYDEGMAPSGFQDIDLVLRVKLGGGKAHDFKRDGSAGWSIRNNLAERKRRPRDKVTNVNPAYAELRWDAMNDANVERSKVQCHVSTRRVFVVL